ncbi:metal-binding protein [Sulfurifustis variabilis]|uniref:Metal-binding protein n=1 Tax=Sulfurifustis variabilis TaxID=1675686 RepID=A0A1B4V275_9GAMM|nr:DUF411 domain-containing protein [Sulfurifustis variabilis]BAU47593.1 metal-binding protein [Sulfurifustis variabilis]
MRASARYGLMVLLLGFAGGIVFWSVQGSAGEVTVYKSPTCGCCKEWVKHLEANGFEVTTRDVGDVTPQKAKHGVRPELASCHTALVDGYVVEGHVPAADLKRLLRERPAVKGLSVPGMPMGSPGMEGPYKERYDVLTFDDAGRTTVYARH